MKYKLIGIFIILIGCVFTSCVQPTGSISGGGGSSSANFFYVINVRGPIYLDGSIEEKTFSRNEHCLKVLGADIDDPNLIIEINTAPIFAGNPPDDLPQFLLPGGSYLFIQSGKYIITGRYKGKEDECPIYVYGAGLGGGGGFGTEIEWLE